MNSLRCRILLFTTTFLLSFIIGPVHLAHFGPIRVPLSGIHHDLTYLCNTGQHASYASGGSASPHVTLTQQTLALYHEGGLSPPTSLLIEQLQEVFGRSLFAKLRTRIRRTSVQNLRSHEVGRSFRYFLLTKTKFIPRGKLNASEVSYNQEILYNKRLSSLSI